VDRTIVPDPAAVAPFTASSGFISARGHEKSPAVSGRA